MPSQISLKTHLLLTYQKNLEYEPLCSVHIQPGLHKPHGEKHIRLTDLLPGPPCCNVVVYSPVFLFFNQSRPFPLGGNYGATWICPEVIPTCSLICAQIFHIFKMHSSPIRMTFTPFYHFPGCIVHGFAISTFKTNMQDKLPISHSDVPPTEYLFQLSDCGRCFLHENLT